MGKHSSKIYVVIKKTKIIFFVNRKRKIYERCKFCLTKCLRDISCPNSSTFLVLNKIHLVFEWQKLVFI
ncbi:MAG TPA: hypothetical protein DCG69_08910 [Bacteroidales bacterium]|nr:hypothetical protein [Bacteroidales bacterium]